MLNENINLDTTWIINYNKKEKINNLLLKKNLNKINIYLIYLENNKIKFFYKKIINLINNKLDFNSLYNIIHNYKNIDLNNFILFKILKFEINIKSFSLYKFINNKEEINLTNISNFENINFNNNLDLFNKVASLFLIFKCKNTKSIKLTRKNKRIKE